MGRNGAKSANPAITVEVMSMISTKKNAQYLAAILLERGIHDIIFSPGSRNAPLIQTCAAIKEFRCLNIVDERCAAFFALGMALNRQKPVAIACTSGSAALNYAPAISEAYYQKIPLLVLTADRPEAWVDQGDGQTIRQQNIYENYTKGSYHLREDMETDDDAWFGERIVNEALNALMYPEMGPVHINIPFKEPLYELTEKNLPQAKIMTLHHGETFLAGETMKSFGKAWHTHPRRMIFVGQMPYDAELNALLGDLSADPSIVILAENLANLRGEQFCFAPERILTLISDGQSYRPDLLITCGGAVVSKKLKTFLRQHKPSRHWHISPAGEPMDTFMSLTDIIPARPFRFLRDLKEYMTPSPCSYGDDWRQLDAIGRSRHILYLQNCEFSDMLVFDLIFARLPDDSVLHLSNSSP
ncbi:MAG: 2-succinyl-5-enolpyruvyl-6-hydroxy-3-cyclohexene-1-carboxylic-acid synthase, partial [Syntrophobacterales bacterium]|nr:2-succinyl-5-enolpyruvyl-6-hydroxy-3-cyclohexene-1-carboxylic-acid synthase [Syntrophobacterales bacterium]